MHFHFQHEEITKFIKKHKIHEDILARLNILNVVLNMQFKVKIKNFALSKYKYVFSVLPFIAVFENYFGLCEKATIWDLWFQ